MSLIQDRPVVFTAQSRHLYYARMLVCRHAIEQGAVPINPFNAFGYFLHDLVPRDEVRIANNNLVRIADALWVYGEIADGVWAEIVYAMQLGKPIRLFSAGPKPEDFAPRTPAQLRFEADALPDLGPQAAIAQLQAYLDQTA